MNSPTSSSFRLGSEVRTVLSRYDLLLGVIPLAFGSAITTAVISSLPIEGTLFVAALVGVLAILDAVLYNPPHPGGR